MIKEVPYTEEYLYELASIYLFDKKEAVRIRRNGSSIVWVRSESRISFKTITGTDRSMAW
jgi:adenosine deaminase